MVVIAHSMPTPYGDKEKAEEYVRDRQGTTKEQGQGTIPDSSSNSNTDRLPRLILRFDFI